MPARLLVVGGAAMIIATGCVSTLPATSPGGAQPATSPGGAQPATSSGAATGSPTTEPSPTRTAPASTVRDPVEDAWTDIAYGLEERWWRDETGNGLDLYALRMAPGAYDLGVAYDPDRPMSLEGWVEATGADVVANAGFFDGDNRATALVVSGGTPTGTSYRDFGGMLAEWEAGPALTWLGRTPFTSTVGIRDAIQSAPMLVYDGEAVYTDASVDSSRRTAVGMDRSGRIVLIAAPRGGYTLDALAERLLAPDLDLDRALNLDGGSSSGIRVQEPWREIPALVPLPAVITFHRR